MFCDYYEYFKGIDYEHYEDETAIASCEEEHDVPENETADYGFSRGEADKITREIQERINRLRVLGVSQLVIQRAFSFRPKTEQYGDYQGLQNLFA
ncbi:MAG: hypothetical protein LKM37_05000 [Bacteroidales bacterium]|jgi:hypothetical protein|nr:hypothetical protein [Bacteroidales bacterium]